MYQATVPVFRHYLSRISDIVALAGPDALDAALADMPTARWQFATAAGFAMRVTCRLAGREVPDLPEGLGPRLAVARGLLGAMKAAEFEGAEARVIHHCTQCAWFPTTRSAPASAAARSALMLRGLGACESSVPLWTWTMSTSPWAFRSRMRCWNRSRPSRLAGL